MQKIEKEIDEKIKTYAEEFEKLKPYTSEWNAPSAFLDLSKDEQIKLYTWCKYLPKIKSFNRSITSYGLKHVYEYNTGEYVGNGAFKGAMLLSGFKIANAHDLNWYFNVSKKCIGQLQEARQKSMDKNYKRPLLDDVVGMYLDEKQGKHSGI